MVVIGVVQVVAELLGFNQSLNGGCFYNNLLISLNMKFLLLIIISFFTFSCQEKKNEIAESKNFKNDSIITIIFNKRTYEKDTLKYPGGQYSYSMDKIYYSIDSSFIKNNLDIKNYKTTDTVLINSRRKVYLYHPFHFYFNSCYILKPGQTVVFDYVDDAPYIRFTNGNNSDSLGTNENVKINLKYAMVEDNLSFFLKNKRFRNKIEEEKNQVDYKNRNIAVINQFKSLKDANKISSELFDIYKKSYSYNTNSFKNKDFFNKKLNLSNKTNQDLLLSYFNFSFKPKMIQRGDGAIQDSKGQFDTLLTIKDINAENRDYLLFTFFESLINDFGKDDIKRYFEIFKKEVTDKKLIEYFEKKYPIVTKPNSTESEKVILTKITGENLFLDDVIKNNKGKLIYIDYWASWCAPCRELMPDSKKLNEDYKDKNILFIYISIDKNADAWREASIKEHINKNVNYISQNYPEANLYQELQLKTIPRYILYDKEGKLVNQNAPGPNSKEIREEFNKYLAQ